jgi:hypothetical protein
MAATVFVQITRSQRVTLYAATTLGVADAPIVSGPDWEVDNPGICTIVPSADGYMCDVFATGTPGVCNVTCTATGQALMTVTTEVTVITDYADTLRVTTSTAIPQ